MSERERKSCGDVKKEGTEMKERRKKKQVEFVIGIKFLKIRKSSLTKRANGYYIIYTHTPFYTSYFRSR